MATEYSLVQTVFSLSGASNAISGLTDTSANLASYLYTYLQGGSYPDSAHTAGPNGQSIPVTGLKTNGFFPQMNAGTYNGNQLAGGDWQLIWGPCVTTAPKPGANQATNAAFIAYSPSQNVVTLAIAATNAASPYDWITEDFNVAPDKMVAWKKFNPTDYAPVTPRYDAATDSIITDVVKAAEAVVEGVLEDLLEKRTASISRGTAIGVSNLLINLVDKNGTSQSLLDFLIKLPTAGSITINADTQLIVTGHSLGGALSPTMAQYLFEQLSVQSPGWNHKNIRVLPSAGATPGNDLFARLFTDTFPSDIKTNDANYPHWNVDLVNYGPVVNSDGKTVNAGDMVPLAWNQLGKVGSLLQLPPYQTIFGAVSNHLVLFKDLPALLGLSFLTGLGIAESKASHGHYTNIPQQLFTPTPGYYNACDVWTPLPIPGDKQPITSLQQLLQHVIAAHIDQYGFYLQVKPGPVSPAKQATQCPCSQGS